MIVNYTRETLIVQALHHKIKCVFFLIFSLLKMLHAQNSPAGLAAIDPQSAQAAAAAAENSQDGNLSPTRCQCYKTLLLRHGKLTERKAQYG